MKKVFQVLVCVFFSTILAATALSDPFESKAEDIDYYYGFEEISSLQGINTDQVVYFSSTAGSLPTGRVTSLPTETGILKVTSGIKTASQSPTDNNAPKGYDYLCVDVVASDSQFDGCRKGYIFFNNGTLYYNCNVGGIGGPNGRPSLAGSAIYTCLYHVVGTPDPDLDPPAPVPIPVPEPVPVPVPVPEAAPQPVVYVAPAPAPEPVGPEYVHEHNYFWQEGIHATEDNNGELEYICPECGEVIFRVPTSAYAVFNSNAQQKILTAPAGSKVTIDTERWISFHKSVLQALAYRPDVSLEVNFLSEGHKGDRMSFTIPAGTDINALLNNEDYCGFLYLNGCMNAGMSMAAAADAEITAAAPAAATDNTANVQEDTQAQPKPQPKPEAEPSANAIAGGQITIPSGVDSYYVAGLLEQAGIIDSAAAYDRYLVANGYDRRIQIGTKTIPEGADNEQIARIITAR